MIFLESNHMSYQHSKNITIFTNFHFRLILPNGLRFCTDKEIRTLEPKSHSFVLTKEDGEKNFGYVYANLTF